MAYLGGSGPEFGPISGVVGLDLGLLRGFWPGFGPISGGFDLVLGHFWSISGVLGLDAGLFWGFWTWIWALFHGSGIFGLVQGFWTWIWALFHGFHLAHFSGIKARIGRSGFWEVRTWILAHFGRSGLDLGLFCMVRIWAYFGESGLKFGLF